MNEFYVFGSQLRELLHGFLGLRPLEEKQPPARVSPEVFFPSNHLPPGADDACGGGMFLGEFVQKFIIDPRGQIPPVLLTRVARARFTNSAPPPDPGQSARYQFQATVSYDLSFDGGKTWITDGGTADVDVRVDWNREEAGKQFFDATILRLDITGEVASYKYMFRVSPKDPSKGVTTIRPHRGGYMISAWFDVWSEVSIDNGQTWITADIPGAMDLAGENWAMKRFLESSLTALRERKG